MLMWHRTLVHEFLFSSGLEHPKALLFMILPLNAGLRA
jgi:hypothetical protein